MITAFFAFLKMILPTIIYMGWIVVLIASVVKRVEWGMLLLIAMVPQPNVFYLLYPFPLGQDLLNLSLISIVLGIFVQKNGFAKTPSLPIILLFLLYSYMALWNVSIRFALPAPITTDNTLLKQWKDYAQMIFLYFLVVNTFKEEKGHRMVLALLSLVLLFISVRAFRDLAPGEAFSDSGRYEGPFWRMGLNSNHYGAFITHYLAALLGSFFFEKEFRRRFLLAATLFFGTYSILFSYSRGAYIAALAVLTFYGVLHKRSLLILVGVLLFTWTTLLPSSVVDRIQMTKSESGEIEHSVTARFDLWEQAWSLFLENPILGAGYDGFYLKMESIQSHLKDTHNFYLKTLCEQGIVGSVLFGVLLFTALRQGWKLYRIGNSPFYRGLGLGFLGAICAIMITNGFGDRWSYFVIGGYFWVLWGLVDRGIMNSESEESAKVSYETTEETPQ